MALPYLTDSRRLTGPSLLLPGPGAIIEVEPPVEEASKLISHWRYFMRGLHQRMGWKKQPIATRRLGANAMLATAAPVDLLHLATYMNEWCWDAALCRLDGDRFESLAEAGERYAGRAERRANLRYRRLYSAANRRRVQLQLGEGDISLGEGKHCKVWDIDEVPDLRELDFSTFRHWIPTALITGTNGKTTTTRMLAKILIAAGHNPGFCSTDVVQVGDEIVDRNDYSGPGGARAVLRHPDTTAAILETARGGLLRRGLQVRYADVGVVTNVGDDHLGDLGINTVEQLAEVKFLIQHGLAAGAPMVVNAEDVHCRRHARRMKRPVIWFSLRPPSVKLLAGTQRPAGVMTVREGRLHFERGRKRLALIAADAIPACHGGSATHNIANALAAAAAALAMKVPPEAINQALSEFGSDPKDNPGRATLFNIAGATVLMDFGHNPEGVRAVFNIAEGLPRERLLVSFGQAGDRTDQALRDLSDALADQKPDRVIVKEMNKYHRGREAGEIPTLLRGQLLARGLVEDQLAQARSEDEVLAQTLEWLQPGDLAILFVHSDIERISDELSRLSNP